MNSTDLYESDLDLDPDDVFDPDADDWLEDHLEDFETRHANPQNARMQWFCIPFFFVGVFGLIWAIPTPVNVSEYGTWLNLGTLAVLIWVLNYFRISLSLGVGMLLAGASLLLSLDSIHKFNPTLVWKVAAVSLVAALAVQQYGQRLEEEPVSFKDCCKFLFRWSALAFESPVPASLHPLLAAT